MEIAIDRIVGRKVLDITGRVLDSKGSPLVGARVTAAPDGAKREPVAALTDGDGRFTLRLRVADVLDAQRFDIVGFPLPRRAAFLALEAKW